VGGVAAAAAWLAARARLPSLAAWAALAAALLVTGGFHEDGLADTCDGLFGGRTPARRLEIMRDSRLGTYGVLALVLTLGVEVAALGLLPLASLLRALPAAHAIARAAALPLTILPYARGDGDGLGRPLARRVPATALGLALVTGGAALTLLPWRAALGCATAAALLAIVCGWRFARDLGGITGDTLGAVVKLVEVACYLVIATALAWS
jgi:adenosylcobinamide-GDP ribazoletransferase